MKPNWQNGWIRLIAAAAFLAAALSAGGQTASEKKIELYLCGQPGAPIKIEVFSDYECPQCRAFYLDTLKPVIASYATKVYIVYHDFPLEMHPYARKGSRLALAAARISRDTWLKVTDTLYTTQDQWSEKGNIEAVLAKVLDASTLAQMQKLAADPAIEAALNQEILLGQSRHLSQTPTWWMILETGQQQRIDGRLDYPVVKEYIDRALKK